VSGESVKLTRVDSIFFSIYYDFIFFQFHHFTLNYFSLSFVIFFASLSDLLFQEGVGQANPDQLAFLFAVFFLSWSHVACDELIELSRVDSDFFPLIFYYGFFSISSFYIKLSSFDIFCFFIFLIVWLFREWVSKVNLDWLRVILTLFFYWTLVFLLSHPFKILFLSQSHIMGCHFVKLLRDDSGFLLWCCIFWSFLFGFHLKY
jgi:hypothetical protein